MAKTTVSLVKVNNVYESLKEALELCNGLVGLTPQDNILIKPNIVTWDFDLPFPPFGVVTTSAVIGALVQILAENGFSNITIGEGSVNVLKSKGDNIFKTLGYDKLQERYGVQLANFNLEKFVEVDCNDGIKFNIAKRALEADKIINVPVLKTHSQVKVSLGIKNMKGCVNQKSKQFCHGMGNEELSVTFPRIIEKLPVVLTIIDGIFNLEKGPLPTGKAFKKDLLIASTDTFSCDLVGAEILGYEGKEVAYLRDYAERHGYSLDLADYKIKGEKVEDHKAYVEYDWEWTKEDTGPTGFEKRGISGLAIRKYDSTLCTGCSEVYNPMLILFSSAFKGEPFPNVEVICGKQQVASAGFDYTVLFGKCSCHLNKDNPNINNPIFLWGCPPDMNKMVETLRKYGILCDIDEYVRFRHYLMDRYKDKESFAMSYWSIK